MTINDAEYQFLSLFVEGDGTIQDKRYAFYTGVLDGSISVGGISEGEADEKFVPREIPVGSRVYGSIDGGVTVQPFLFGQGTAASSLAQRTSEGQLRVGTAVLSDAAVTKAQLDALEARVIALEGGGD